MTDLKGKSLDQMEKEGLIDMQIPINASQVENSQTTSSIIGNLPVTFKLAIAGLVLLVIFGIINVPIWVYHFANN